MDLLLPLLQRREETGHLEAVSTPWDSTKKMDDLSLLGKQLPDWDGVKEVSWHLGEKASGSVFSGVLGTWPGFHSASGPRFTFPLTPAGPVPHMQLVSKETLLCSLLLVLLLFCYMSLDL